MKSILDPTFRYVSSANTDLRKSFERIRREMVVTASQRAVAPKGNVHVFVQKPQQRNAA